MKRALVMTLSCGLMLAGGAIGPSVAARAGGAPAPRVLGAPRIPPGLHAQPVCGAVPIGFARCLSMVLVDAQGRPFTSPLPAGYGPPDFQDAYKLPSGSEGKGVTVAVVDAYDDPNAEADLAVYRNTYGLPPCTTKNGCFKKVNQNGGSHLPDPNGLWALEISLDVDMVSAICPNCNILLVEAESGSISHLGPAVNTAVRKGAHAVSNSYENRLRHKNRKEEKLYYRHPGVAITVASGDWGYNYRLQFPADSPYVISVGGTTLTRAQNDRGWNETVWSGTGSECSDREPKPSWQTDTGCENRTAVDVAADASPGTGAAVYDTYGQGGWLVVGGTSESSPIIASVFALANDKVQYGSRVYMNPEHLYDVTSGSNGTCSPTYLCTAGTGYDGPTGLGTPHGIGDF
jgi:subtilase family serine protease